MIVGSIFESSYLVCENTFISFRDTFKDHNPLHLSDQHAKKHGFKSKVMYGNILSGYLSHFVGELLPLKEIIIITQTINFNKPFYLNQTICLSACIKSFYESVNIYDITFDFYNANNLLIASGKIKIKALI
jgi:3-hydroxybutyryl-CoA dehydratase